MSSTTRSPRALLHDRLTDALRRASAISVEDAFARACPTLPDHVLFAAAEASLAPWRAALRPAEHTPPDARIDCYCYAPLLVCVATPDGSVDFELAHDAATVRAPGCFENVALADPEALRALLDARGLARAGVGGDTVARGWNTHLHERALWLVRCPDALRAHLDALEAHVADVTAPCFAEALADLARGIPDPVARAAALLAWIAVGSVPRVGAATYHDVGEALLFAQSPADVARAVGEGATHVARLGLARALAASKPGVAAHVEALDDASRVALLRALRADGTMSELFPLRGALARAAPIEVHTERPCQRWGSAPGDLPWKLTAHGDTAWAALGATLHRYRRGHAPEALWNASPELIIELSASPRGVFVHAGTRVFHLDHDGTLTERFVGATRAMNIATRGTACVVAEWPWAQKPGSIASAPVAGRVVLCASLDDAPRTLCDDAPPGYGLLLDDASLWYWHAHDDATRLLRLSRDGGRPEEVLVTPKAPLAKGFPQLCDGGDALWVLLTDGGVHRLDKRTLTLTTVATFPGEVAAVAADATQLVARTHAHHDHPRAALWRVTPDEALRCLAHFDRELPDRARLALTTAGVWFHAADTVFLLEA